ncbi:hypothetical protein LCGC14_1753720 [marine sediment metagenome]|uniref:Uncharacterized protein n=1 Tax=marine sediment metagenome TaxID=412755 RepID=A0A0F9H343_9ZZZZ
MGVDTGKLHLDTALTNVSVRYRNSEFMADLVFPEVPVDKQSNKYPVYGRDIMRPVDDLRRPGAVSNEIDWDLSHSPYYCDGHALNMSIPDEWRGNADQGLNLDVDTTEELTEKIDLNREVNLVAALVAGATTVDLTAIKWDNDSNDPLAKIDEQKEAIAKKIGKMPNVLALSQPVFRGIKHNAKVTGLLTGAVNLSSANVTAGQLAEHLELDEVIVAKGVKVTSAVPDPSVSAALNSLPSRWKRTTQPALGDSRSPA